MNHSKATAPQCAPWYTDTDTDDQMCPRPEFFRADLALVDAARIGAVA